jgi:hypothetical protein
MGELGLGGRSFHSKCSSICMDIHPTGMRHYSALGFS